MPEVSPPIDAQNSFDKLRCGGKSSQPMFPEVKSNEACGGERIQQQVENCLKLITAKAVKKQWQKPPIGIAVIHGDLTQFKNSDTCHIMDVTPSENIFYIALYTRGTHPLDKALSNILDGKKLEADTYLFRCAWKDINRYVYTPEIFE